MASDRARFELPASSRIAPLLLAIALSCACCDEAGPVADKNMRLQSECHRTRAGW
jgi:hypothetical protein